MQAEALVGVIFFSPNPQRLALFYKTVLGIPFQLETHGKMPEHFECFFQNTHLAILKRAARGENKTVVPSFKINNLSLFLEQSETSPLHPIIDLGEGKKVTSINDPDGNMIRLIQLH